MTAFLACWENGRIRSRSLSRVPGTQVRVFESTPHGRTTRTASATFLRSQTAGEDARFRGCLNDGTADVPVVGDTGDTDPGYGGVVGIQEPDIAHVLVGKVHVDRFWSAYRDRLDDLYPWDPLAELRRPA